MCWMQSLLLWLGAKKEGEESEREIRSLSEDKFLKISYIEELVTVQVQQMSLNELSFETTSLFEQLTFSLQSTSGTVVLTLVWCPTLCSSVHFRQEIFFGVPGYLNEVVVMMQFGSWWCFIMCCVRVLCDSKLVWAQDQSAPREWVLSPASLQPPAAGAVRPVVLSAAMNGEWLAVCSDESWSFFMFSEICLVLFYFYSAFLASVLFVWVQEYMWVFYIFLKARLWLSQRDNPKLKASQSGNEPQMYVKKASVPRFPQIKKKFWDNF